MSTTVAPAPPAAGPATGRPLRGTAALVRLAVRRDGWWAAVTVLGLAAVAAGSAAATAVLYPDPASVRAAAETINVTPALTALYGPLADTSSVGAFGLWKPAGTGAVVVALVTLFGAVRHSRAEEDSGRAELVLGAGAVGRAALVASAWTVASAHALLIGAVTAAGLAGAGLPLAGGVAFGAAWAACGVVFAGVGAVAAQVARSARGARMLGLAVLAVAFALRATGDAVGPAALTWISPLGWVQLTRAYADERWGVLLPPAVLAAVLAALAVRLAVRRDLGAGVLPEPAGRPAASPWLSGPAALAVRLHRGGLLAWAVGLALVAALLGSVAGDVEALLDSAPMRAAVAALGGSGGLVDAFLAADLAMFGLIAAAFAVQAVLGLAAEEQAGRADLLLAGPVGRTRWALGHLGVAVGGAVLLMVVVGVAAGAARGDLWRVALAALVPLPAIAVVAGATLLLVGLTAHAAPWAWALFAGVVAVAELGALLRWPDGVTRLSPFAHLPHAPAEPVTAGPLLGLSAVAAALVAAGLVLLARRDLG